MSSLNPSLAAIRTVRLPLRLDRLRSWAAGWALAEQGRLAPWLTVCMGAGVAAYFNLRAEPAWWAGLALCAFAACCVALVRRGFVARPVACAALAAAIGFGSAQWATHRAPPLAAWPTTASIVTGVVQGVEIRPEGRRITLADAAFADGAPSPRTLHIILKSSVTVPLAAGDTIRVRAVLRPPAPPAFPGAWDLQRDAYYSVLGASGGALGAVEVLAHHAPIGPARWLQGVRDAIAGRIMAAIPGAQGAIAATLLTGTTSAIPPDDRAAFRDSGLAHLLAVAGLHIGIVMGLVMGTMRLVLACSERAALYWPCKQVAAGTALAAGLGYLLLTGAHVPILRSFAMAALVTLGVALGRRAISVRGLALAGALIMLAAPQEVVGVSFQMSFAAVLALIAGYEAMQPVLARLRGDGWGRHTARHAAALVLTSLLAGVASAPFGAYHFGHVQAYFILANLVAVPLAATWIMPAGMAALLLMPFGLEHLALVPMGWGIEVVLWIARTVAALPAATIGVPHMPVWGLAVLSLGLAWLGLWRTRLRLAGVALIAAGLLSGAVDPAADLLVSNDARIIALAGAPGLIQTRPGYAHFVADSWSQYWAEPLTTSFPENGQPGAVRCSPDGCRIERSGTAVMLARSMRPMDCTGVVLVVSSEPNRGVCPGVAKIDRFSVWRDGAFAVWMRDGEARMVSDRDVRGARPWVPPPPTARAARTGLPMAQTDAVPD